MRIVKELDKLIEAGIFRSRSEAVAESLRKLLLEYSTLVEGESFIVEAYLSGRLERDLGPNDTVEVSVEEAKENLVEFFGTADADAILKRVRGGTV